MRIDDFRLSGASIDEINSPTHPQLKIRSIRRVSIGDEYIVFKENHHCSDSCYDDVLNCWFRVYR
jgi:hypothetical protein